MKDPPRPEITDSEAMKPSPLIVNPEPGVPTTVVNVAPTPSSHPGLKERGVLELTLHADGREAAGVPVDPAQIFDFASEHAAHKLWDTCSHTIARGQELPEPFRGSPVFIFTAVNEHFTFTRPDYIHASFFEPAQVFVLLTSTTKVPQWLRNDFVRLPEAKASMAVDWQFGLHTKVLAVLSQKLSSIRAARLHVWQRKEHCVPGVGYTFGGTEGNSPLEDYTYLLAWRLLGAEEVVHPGQKLAVAAAADSEDSQEDRRALLGRIAEAVAEDDLEMLRRAMEAYRARARQSPGAWPRPSFLTSSGVLLTTVAAQRHAQPRLLLYLVAQGAELDATGFRYLLSNAKSLQSGGFTDVAHLVLSYVARGRNPISSAMVLAHELDDAAATNSAKAKDWRELAARLRSVAVELVGGLEKLEVPQGEEAGAATGAPGAATEAADADGRGGGGAGSAQQQQQPSGALVSGEAGVPGWAPGTDGGGAFGGVPPTIGDILAPRGVAVSVNDASPLAVAYDTNDLEFISAPVVQGYLQDRWLGPDYILLALQDKGASLHYQDHHMMLRVLEGSGFVGSLGRPVMRLHSYVLHMLVFASRAFFDSPRGRWVFKMFLEAFFLYIFHSIQLMQDESSLAWQHIVFVLYVGGMLVDELQEGAHQYGGRVAHYFASGFNVVEALCWLMLTASVGLKVAMWALPDGQEHPHWEDLRTAKAFIYNTASILVWARLLQYIIPLYDGMGSQLMVISQMFREVFKFAIPGTILLTGVAFALHSMFRDRGIPELASFPMTMLKLFRTFLGETMFDLYASESVTIYNLYGNIITLLYALVATVVLANLLIALISYHFQPEKTELQSRFQMAEILAHYEYMVEHHLVGAPFSLPQLALTSLLPSGARQKGSSSALVERFVMTPMDGIVVSGEDAGSKFLPTGSNEVPYLLFLLTLWPACLALSWALYFGMAPYCIAYFTLMGYRKWTGGGGGGKQTPFNRGSAKVKPEEASAAAASSSASASASAAVDMVELHDGGAAGPPASPGLAGPGGHVGGPEGHDGWSTSQRLASLGRLSLRCVLYLASRPLWLLVGCLGYCVLLGGLLVALWLGVYTWAGKLVFHSYWVGRGWLQGWFGESNVVLAQREGASTAASASRRASRRTTPLDRLADCAWVRVQQAALKDGGQVITWAEIARALRHAGFRRSEVAMAAAGALASSDLAAGLTKRKISMAASAPGVPGGSRAQPSLLPQQRVDASLTPVLEADAGDDSSSGSDSSTEDDERGKLHYATLPANAGLGAGGGVAAVRGAGGGGTASGDGAAAASAFDARSLARVVARQLRSELREAVTELRREVREVTGLATNAIVGGGSARVRSGNSSGVRGSDSGRMQNGTG